MAHLPGHTAIWNHCNSKSRTPGTHRHRRVGALFMLVIYTSSVHIEICIFTGTYVHHWRTAALYNHICRQAANCVSVSRRASRWVTWCRRHMPNPFAASLCMPCMDPLPT
ncbi:hypothetical protein GDO78_011437 [Eleutherodactylus coqui]|uniref:Uncharacterized protein n=1 Tax=Eleutherodactylus coqui TaxID=57060 RepID=A0A8J6F740_ELECQ|nr:hypothetical protein GDO78_011437 [Eleutherodactylus coqui]